MYRGFCKIKTPIFRAFSQSPRLVAGVKPPLLSTEIICQGGFCPGFAVTSRINPYIRIFTQLIYNTKPQKICQAFDITFLNFFEIFFGAEIFAQNPLRATLYIIYYKGRNANGNIRIKNAPHPLLFSQFSPP